MNAESANVSWWRFSLRELLLLIGFVALACVSLKYAGFVWVLTLSAAASLLFMGAAVVAVVDRGRRQAAAIGLALCLAIYGIVFWSSPRESNGRQSRELDPYDAQLPTSKALYPLFTVMVHGTYRDSAGNEIKDYDPNQAATMGMGSGMFGGGGMGGGMGGMGGGAYYHEVPERSQFMGVGHLLWALLLGCLGSRLAVWSYDRRAKAES